ncbi:hypothetical protein [Saccharothrix sp. HUAS TT1]|uniref:hypothetical protein n=1 Tax=unclassified Saccharothrix TaxID=2593673 RepID=UPI00345BA2D0
MRPPDPAQPPEIVRDTFFLCAGRSSERVESLRCTVCGWHGRPDPEAEAGDDAPLTLFPEPGTEPHTVEECARRQRDPWFRYEQDSARLAAAGLPGILTPPRTPRPTSDPAGIDPNGP